MKKICRLISNAEIDAPSLTVRGYHLSEMNFAKRGESSESKKVKIRVVVEIDGGQTRGQNIHDADGYQPTINVVVLMVGSEGELRISTIGGE